MGEYSKAGRLLERGGETQNALKLYLSWGTNAAIEQVLLDLVLQIHTANVSIFKQLTGFQLIYYMQAIDLVQKAKCETLSNQLFEYLNKHEHKAEENQYHFYMLHKALGNFDIASDFLSILAEEEQVLFWPIIK